MPDDNQTQDINAVPTETQTPETPTSTPIEQSIPTTDSTPSDMPSEPQNGSQDVIDTPVVKDDNGAVISELDKTPSETEQVASQTEAQTEPISEPAQVIEAENPVVSQAPTPQMSTFEPLASNNHMSELLEKEHEAINNKRQKRLDSIMNLFAKQTNITNDEVEKFLHVSNATATRYLSILKKENKILQNGKTGKGFFYTLIK